MIPAEPALASAGVVGDGQTSGQGIQKLIRILMNISNLDLIKILNIPLCRCLSEALVQTPAQVDTTHGLHEVSLDQGVSVPE